MKHRSLLGRLGLPALAVALLSAAAVRPQQDADAVELVLEPVAGAVSVLFGRGGNIGVSQGPDGLLVVDDQFAWLAEKIHARLRELEKGDPRYLVNTHYHGDHTGGNAYFGELATLVAHENVRARLAAGDETRRRPPAEPVALPRLTYPETMSLHFNGEEIRLVHLPTSHTDGDTAVWFTKSNVVHLGDTFFHGRFPFIDVGAGGHVDGMIAALEALYTELPDDVRLIPGHGPVGGKTELRAYLDVLHETRQRVADALEAGRTLDEMRELRLFEDLAPTWGSGFIDADAHLATLVSCLQGS